MQRAKRLHYTITATVLGILLLMPPNFTHADSAVSPSLIISQLKITSSNGQFITLYNTTNSALDMSKYQLEYFNNYNVSKATSSRLINLSGSLPPHGYLMVNDSAMLLCYQLTVDSLSLGLSSTSGMVEVFALNQANAGESITSTLQDYVAWSKTTASGAQTLPSDVNAFLQRLPVDLSNNPAINTPGAGRWQSVRPDANNACSLLGAGNGLAVEVGPMQLLPSTEPPVTMDSVNPGSGVPTAALPTTDIGLMAPVITEILPNPMGTGNDSKEEFIELYNANAVDFDLSGFSLRVGTSGTHTFTFPSGTRLHAQSFTAFYASTTGLSLSNSGGLVRLFDPLDNNISTTGAYGTTKDGQAWALANGKWYWTTTPTPNKANAIHEPTISTTKRKSLTSKSTGSFKVKTIKMPKAKKTKQKKLKATRNTSTLSPEESNAPIHMRTLALVASLALLYGAYEYRADMANRIRQLSRNIKGRRHDRP